MRCEGLRRERAGVACDIVIIKTTGDRLDALHARIKALHTYEVPEFLVLAGEGSDEYLAWMADTTRVTGRT